MNGEARIHQRLDDVAASLGEISTVQAVQGEQITSIKGTVGDMKLLLHGSNGKGLKTKVDRLGENEKRRTWQIRSIYVALIAVVVSAGVKIALDFFGK